MKILYLAFKEEQVIANNDPIKNYREIKYALNKVSEKLGNIAINKISRFTIRNVTREWQEEQKKNGTIKKRLNMLKAAINHIYKDGYIDKVPYIELPPTSPARELFMTPAQVKKFINCIDTLHIRLFALLATYTLSRKRAILDLTWERVDLENKMIDFNVPGRRRHNKKRVEVPIISKELCTAREFAQSYYVIEYMGKPVFDMRRAFAKWAKKAEMEWVTPHVLRLQVQLIWQQLA